MFQDQSAMQNALSVQGNQQLLRVLQQTAYTYTADQACTVKTIKLDLAWTMAEHPKLLLCLTH